MKLPRRLRSASPRSEKRTVAPNPRAESTPNVDHGLDSVLRPRHVIAALGVSRATLYRLVASGRFPRPFRVSANVSGWRMSQVQQFIHECASTETPPTKPCVRQGQRRR